MHLLRVVVPVLLVFLLALGAKEAATGWSATPEGSAPSQTVNLDTFVPVPDNYGPWVPPLPSVGTFNVGGPDTRVQVTDTTVVPFNRIAFLEIDFDGDGIYETTCTGELVGPRLVLTAGHCVYDPLTGMSAHSIFVTPGQNGASTFPFGFQLVSSSALTTTNGWISGDPNFDRGAITLPDQTLYNQVGAFTLAVADDAYLGGGTVNIAGYPGDKPYGTQWTAFGTVTALTSTMLSYNADTAAGESGGPVWTFDGTNRYLVGIHTRGVTSPYCAASSNCGTRITASAALSLESLGANPYVNLTGTTPSPTPSPTHSPTPIPTHSPTPTPTHSPTPTPTPTPTLSPSPTPSPTSTATDWHASNFAWYENVVPSVGTSTCDEAKPVPPNVPNDAGLCVVFDLQIPNGSYDYRVLLTRNGVVFADATFPNVNLYSGPGWNQAFIPPAPGGNFDLKLYANGVLLGESNVTVPGPTPSPTPTAGPPTPTSSPTHTPIPPQTHS